MHLKWITSTYLLTATTSVVERHHTNEVFLDQVQFLQPRYPGDFGKRFPTALPSYMAFFCPFFSTRIPTVEEKSNELFYNIITRTRNQGIIDPVSKF